MMDNKSMDPLGPLRSPLRETLSQRDTERNRRGRTGREMLWQSPTYVKPCERDDRGHAGVLVDEEKRQDSAATDWGSMVEEHEFHQKQQQEKLRQTQQQQQPSNEKLFSSSHARRLESSGYKNRNSGSELCSQATPGWRKANKELGSESGFESVTSCARSGQKDSRSSNENWHSGHSDRSRNNKFEESTKPQSSKSNKNVRLGNKSDRCWKMVSNKRVLSETTTSGYQETNKQGNSLGGMDFVAFEDGEKHRQSSPTSRRSSVSSSTSGDAVRNKNKRETDEGVLSRRQKQIEYGKNTPEYQFYRKLVPKSERTKHHPSTPDKNIVYSRRGFDSIVRIWRKSLHYWDPTTNPQGPPATKKLGHSTTKDHSEATVAKDCSTLAAEDLGDLSDSDITEAINCVELCLPGDEEEGDDVTPDSKESVNEGNQGVAENKSREDLNSNCKNSSCNENDSAVDNVEDNHAHDDSSKANDIGIESKYNTELAVDNTLDNATDNRVQEASSEESGYGSELVVCSKADIDKIVSMDLDYQHVDIEASENSLALCDLLVKVKSADSGQRVKLMLQSHDLNVGGANHIESEPDDFDIYTDL